MAVIREVKSRKKTSLVNSMNKWRVMLCEEDSELEEVDIK